MVDIIKGVKWAVGWKDKAASPLTPEELEEKMQMRQHMRERMGQQAPPKKGVEIAPLIYPLPPTPGPRKTRRLSPYLKESSLKRGRKIFR